MLRWPVLVLVLFLSGCATTPPSTTATGALSTATAMPGPMRHVVPTQDAPAQPILALDPDDAQHAVVATSQFDDHAHTMHVAVTHDGGGNWTDRPVPVTVPVGKYAVAFATGLAIAKGTVYLAGRLEGDTTLPGQVPAAIVVLASKDGGATFGPASLVHQGWGTSTSWDDVVPPLAVADDGRLLTAYTLSRDDGIGFAAATEEVQAVVATSTDGTTWSQTPLGAPSTGLTTPTSEQIPFIGGFQLATGAGGQVLATWVVKASLDADPTIQAATSQDGGLTFGAATPVATVTHGDCRLVDGPGGASCPATAFQRPSLARSGTAAALAYTVFGHGVAQPMVVTSDDGGRSWEAPRTVPGNVSKDRWMPHVAYVGGALHAVYYDASLAADEQHIDLLHASLAGNGTRTERVSTTSFSSHVDDDEDSPAAATGSGILAGTAHALAVVWMEPHQSQMQILYAELEGDE